MSSEALANPLRVRNAKDITEIKKLFNKTCSDYVVREERRLQINDKDALSEKQIKTLKRTMNKLSESIFENVREHVVVFENLNFDELEPVDLDMQHDVLSLQEQIVADVKELNELRKDVPILMQDVLSKQTDTTLKEVENVTVVDGSAASVESKVHEEDVKTVEGALADIATEVKLLSKTLAQRMSESADLRQYLLDKSNKPKPEVDKILEEELQMERDNKGKADASHSLANRARKSPY